jgi:hypothetical protein
MHLQNTWPRYENAKERFRISTARLATPLPQPLSSRNAKVRADAIADCQWYATDLQTTAAVLTALCEAEKRERRA